jgi:hypothetical protein
LLAKIVRFYDVDPLAVPPPRLALVPVPSGFGTHAEAIGGVLLLEIRSGTASRTKRASSFTKTPISSGASFRRSVSGGGERRGGQATTAPRNRCSGRRSPALGQGRRSCVPFVSWSIDPPGTTKDVDACAKRTEIHRRLDEGLTLDDELVRRAVRAAEAPR